MASPRVFSELDEAGALARDLMSRSAPPPRPSVPPPVVRPAEPLTPKVKPPRPPPPRPVPVEAAHFRGDRLTSALEGMCLRAGFEGAVMADQDGLALAAYNSPMDADRLAAFTSVLARALEGAGSMLDQRDANNLSLDINYSSKVVLKRFEARGRRTFLLVVCGQDVDERSEVEATVEQLSSLLA
jgi:predicted regulator of Ras-like GTPase activity (Roadblock/LC7/MglB family)